MALDLRLYSSLAAFQTAIGSAGTKATGESRGGDGGAGALYEHAILDVDDLALAQDTDFVYRNGAENTWSLTWDQSTRTLTWAFSHSLDSTSISAASITAPSLSWDVLGIKLTVPRAIQVALPRSPLAARLRVYDLTFNGEAFGSTWDVSIDTNTLAVGADNSRVIGLWNAALNLDWVLTGKSQLWWGEALSPPTAAGASSSGDMNFPMQDFYQMQALLIDSLPLPITVPLGGDGPEDDATLTCEDTPKDLPPPQFYLETGDGCYRYAYQCVAGNWQLLYAECVDPAFCLDGVNYSGDGTFFELSVNGGCNQADTLQTPVNPTITHRIEPDC